MCACWYITKIKKITLYNLNKCRKIARNAEYSFERRAFDTVHRSLRRARDVVPSSCVSFRNERPEQDTANVNEATGQLLRSGKRDNPRGN